MPVSVDGVPHGDLVARMVEDEHEAMAEAEEHELAALP